MWIESLHVEGGILDGFERRFDPKLNVLIGGRGTGKSSVIELIRFCLGATSHTPTDDQSSIEHALGVLGDGRVTVTLRDGNQRVEVSRTAADPEPESEISFDAPFVFSQSEIETVGLHAQSRLGLIDDFLPRISATRAETASQARVRSITAEIHALLTELDDIREKTAVLQKLQEQLKETKKLTAAQSAVVKEIAEHRSALGELTPSLAAARVRTDAVGRASERVAAWTERFGAHLESAPAIETWPEQAGAPDELAELRKKYKQALSQLRDAHGALVGISNQLAQRRTASTSQTIGLENRARDIRQKIESKQKGASALDKRSLKNQGWTWS